MNTLKVLGGFTLGLAAAALIGCGTPAATGTPAVATTSPAEATGLPVVVSTPLESQPGGPITTAEPVIPPSQEVGVTAGGVVVAGTAVVITALPGGGPTAIPATPQGVPSDVLTVTRDDYGKTITLRVGQTFLLYLDMGQMTWTVTIEDQAIVSRVIGVMPIQGAQGLFKANQPGQTRVMATGDFPCRQSKPPCMLPSMAFQVQIVVQ